MSEQQSCQKQLEAAQAQIRQLSQQLATERETARQLQAQLQGQLEQQQQRLTQLEAQEITYRHLFDQKTGYKPRPLGRL